MFKKALSPVLASIILASVSLAIGITILMWLSSQSTLSLRETQIETLKAELMSKENLVIIHSEVNGGNLVIYLCNMGYSTILLGPLRIYNSSFNLVLYPTSDYILYYNDTSTEVNEKVSAQVGSLSEFAEKLEIRNLSLIPKEITTYVIEQYFERNQYYRLVYTLPPNVLSGTYTIELWSTAIIYDKLYLIKSHIEVITI